jgi:hypothetical protein
MKFGHNNLLSDNTFQMLRWALAVGLALASVLTRLCGSATAVWLGFGFSSYSAMWLGCGGLAWLGLALASVLTWLCHSATAVWLGLAYKVWLGSGFSIDSTLWLGYGGLPWLSFEGLAWLWLQYRLGCVARLRLFGLALASVLTQLAWLRLNPASP